MKTAQPTQPGRFVAPAPDQLHPLPQLCSCLSHILDGLGRLLLQTRRMAITAWSRTTGQRTVPDGLRLRAAYTRTATSPTLGSAIPPANPLGIGTLRLVYAL